MGSYPSDLNKTTHLIKIRKMTGTRGPKRKTMEAKVGEKRSKLEEELKAKMVKVKIKCEDPRCKANKRFRDGFTSHKMFYNHMALFHGGLETYLRNHERQELRDLVSRLPCHKLPDVCFVPDHYG